MIFEGIDTGIEHEWNVPIKANTTRIGQNLQFSTPQFKLPTRAGWYTVNAKLSDRFDQTWMEWSFQFQVGNDICKSCDQTKQSYIESLKANIQKIKQSKSTEAKFTR